MFLSLSISSAFRRHQSHRLLLSIPSTSMSPQLSIVPEEMKNSSVDLVLNLAIETASLADESGDGVADTTSTAMIQIIGQVGASEMKCRLFAASFAVLKRVLEQHG